MKSNLYRTGAAALTLVVCLSVAPVATAARPGDGFDFRDRIAKIIKKLRNLPRIFILEDYPGPPKPSP